MSRRHGIATAAIVVVIVVVVAAAGVGVYLATSGSSPSSSTTSTSSAGTTSNPMTETTSSEQMTSGNTVPTTSTTSNVPPTSTTSSPMTTSTSSAGTTYTNSIVTCSGTETSYVQTSTVTTADPLTYEMGLVNQVKGIEVRFNGTSGTTTSAEDFSYAIIASSGSLREINFTISTSSNSSQSISYGAKAWVDTTAMSVINYTTSYNVAGQVYTQTYTGAQAQTFFTSSMEVFYLYQSTFGSQYYAYFTSSDFFHSTGTSTVNVGPTAFTVTTYVANHTPEVVNTCDSVFTLNDYELQVGSPQGMSTVYIVKMHFSGTQVYNGQTTTTDYTYQLVSLTLA